MDGTVMTVIGISIIFVMTSLGSALVFFFRAESKKANTLFLGFASGIMIAASVWSLLLPSIEQAGETFGALAFIPAAVGFVVGGLFLVLLDKVVPHFHSGTNEEEGPHTALSKPVKMMLAVTIHNIPEGLAVGFAFGAAASSGEPALFVSALGLAVGIGIQNFPKSAVPGIIAVRRLGRKFIMKIRYNDDKELVERIKEGLKAKDGYCPCRIARTPENKCMCKEFRDQIADPNYEGYCHCMLYYKEK